MQIEKSESAETQMILTKTFLDDPVTISVSGNGYSWLMTGILKGTILEQWNKTETQTFPTSSIIGNPPPTTKLYLGKNFIDITLSKQ